MRLNAPFPELLAYVNNKDLFDMPSLDLELNSHVPFVVILLQAAELWRQEHEGKMPKKPAEKTEFK